MAYTPYSNRSSYPGSQYNDLYASSKPPNQDFNPVDQIGPSLDTTNARPPLSAPKTATPAATAAASSTPATSTSPELAGLNQSSEAPVTAATPAATTTTAATATPAATSALPAYLQPIVSQIAALQNPVSPATTMDPAVQQAYLNQMTRTGQNATDIAANQMREAMGGATGGLMTPGNSGLADTALGNIYRQGAATTAANASDFAKTQAAQAVQNEQSNAALNLQRILASGTLGQGLASADLGQQGLTYQQQQDALNSLMSLYGNEQGYQTSAWSPYYQGIVNSYSGG